MRHQLNVTTAKYKPARGVEYRQLKVVDSVEYDLVPCFEKAFRFIGSPPPEALAQLKAEVSAAKQRFARNRTTRATSPSDMALLRKQPDLGAGSEDGKSNGIALPHSSTAAVLHAKVTSGVALSPSVDDTVVAPSFDQSMTSIGAANAARSSRALNAANPADAKAAAPKKRGQLDLTGVNDNADEDDQDTTDDAADDTDDGQPKRRIHMLTAFDRSHVRDLNRHGQNKSAVLKGSKLGPDASRTGGPPVDASNGARFPRGNRNAVSDHAPDDVSDSSSSDSDSESQSGSKRTKKKKHRSKSKLPSGLFGGTRRVLVHCQLGASRSPSFVLAYLVKICGLSLQVSDIRLRIRLASHHFCEQC